MHINNIERLEKNCIDVTRRFDRLAKRDFAAEKNRFE